jgi:PST family polysaccharide transporter
LVRNAASLYGVQICRKLLPLVSVPYLAHVLGPSGWGKVAFVQALGEGIVLVLEFGFNLSATREIARHRESPKTCGDVIAGTLGAQALLSIPAVVGAIIASRYIPMLRDEPGLLAAGVLYGVAQGIAPMWFFQGLERMALASALEVGSKIAGLLGLILFVHHRGDEWIVLLLQALAPAVSTVAGFYLAHRFVAFGMPHRRLVKRALVQGWQMFLLRSSSSLYGIANSLVLGLLTTPSVVGYYASAEKVAKSISGLLLPIRESLYPRLSHLVSRSPEESRRLTRLGVILMGGGGLVLGLITAVAAPAIVHTLMGRGFEPSIRVLQVLAALPLIIALTDSVGLQHLLPRGKEKLVNPVMLAGGVLNLLAALVLAPGFGAIGMAWSVVGAETFVCLVLLWIVMRARGADRAAGGTAVEEEPVPVAEIADA